jgi:hypothetical protein
MANPFDAPPEQANPFDAPPSTLAPIGHALDEALGLSKFAAGFREGWGASPPGEAATRALREAGILPDYQRGQTGIMREINEALLRPLLTAVDAAARLPYATARGLAEAAPLIGGPIAAAMEAFPAASFTGLPNVPGAGLAAAEAARVIGHGEAGWKGLPERPAEAEPPTEAPAEPPSAPPAAIAVAESEPPPAPQINVHAAARSIDPQTMEQYDRLKQQRAIFRQQLDELSELRSRQAEELAPGSARIPRLQEQIAAADARRRAILQDRLDRLQAQRSAWIEDYLGHDTPEMARVRQDLMQTDFQMRDLAEAVSAIYRQARQMVPEEISAEQATPETLERPPPPPQAPPPQAPPPQAQPPQAPPPQAPPPRPTTTLPLPPGGIAADVARQLMAAGRPADEAQAAAQIVTAYYDTRAQRFQGRLGTAEDLYAREAATIRGAEQGGPRGVARGRTVMRNGRAIVTLFRRADASTFVHETAHQWLEQLLADAERPEAPEQLRADARTVRDWAQEPTGPLPRAAHERFARNFEAYLLEGVAPSRRLASVFAQFRLWLTEAYRALNRVRAPVEPQLRAIFDRMLTTAPVEPVIAPEQRVPDLATAIEDAAEQARNEDAEEIAEQVSEARARAADRLSEGAQNDRERERPHPAPPAADRGLAPRSQVADGGADEPEIFNVGSRGVPAPRAIGEGGNQTETQGDRAPGEQPQPGITVTLRPLSRRPQSPYAEVPPAPVTLSEFLRRAGGVQNQDGELTRYLRRKPGLINRRGMPLDEATLQAWEAGYLPGRERPEIRVLLQHLERELTDGQPVYSEADRDKLAAWEAAIQHNREIDRLGQMLGVDPRDFTQEQFLNLTAEMLRGEEADELEKSLSDATEAEIAEAERRAQEWAESRGDAWEPDYFAGPPRTWEDLENEERAEAEAYGRLPPSAGGTAPSRPAAGDQGSLQAGARQSRPGAGAGSRQNAAPGPGRPGADRLPPGSDLIDKAGNIRLDLLDLPEQVDQVIRDVAERNSDFWTERRGRMSDGEILDLAQALGRDPAFLDAKRIGEAFNAEEIRAARGLLKAAAVQVYEGFVRVRAALMAGQDAEQDTVALARSIARLEMIQGKVAQATAEWGRAGRALQMLASEAPEDINEFLRQNTGRTFYQLQEMARRGVSFRDPAQVSRFVTDTAGGKITRAVLYYYINALISGPFTHARYSVGNALNALWTPLVEIPLAAAYGKMTAAENRVFLGEAGAQLYALLKGSRDGWRAAIEAYRTGYSGPLRGERPPSSVTGVAAAPLGPFSRAIGVPSRAVSAIHSFFKTLRYEQQIQGLAYRDAMARGLEGDAFARHVAYLERSPTPAMVEEATSTALRELYMSPVDYDSFAGHLVRATDRNILAKIVIPFLRIGSQITRQAFIEHTPLGLASPTVRGRLAGGGPAAQLQAARISAGVALMGVTVGMAAEGLITGDGPDDPAQRAVWRLNHRPNTLTIGDITIPFMGLGHLGMLMRFTANMYETAAGWRQNDGEKLAVSFLNGVSRAVLDDNFMRGLKDALDAVYHWEEYGPRFVRNFVVNWLPYSIGLGQTARQMDPYQREARSIFDAARERIPFLRETLPLMRDVFGEPIPAGAPLARYANDPTVLTLERLQIGIARLRPKIRGVDLDPQQYDDYARIAGRLTKMRLDALVTLPNFHTLAVTQQVELIRHTIADSREAARNIVMGMYPAIVTQALQAKAQDAGQK